LFSTEYTIVGWTE